MNLQPYILGRGMAGTAIYEAISLLKHHQKELSWKEPIWLERNQPLPTPSSDHALAFIANPHAFHAERVLEAHEKGYAGIGLEKPVCVSLEQVERLSKVTTKTAVFHGYRQTWGIQTLRNMMAQGDCGKIISIEGRYWQSSAAERALTATKTNSWKNTPDISGPSDVLLDLGTHWADAAVFLMGELPTQVSGWASYVNSESAHRDNHVHVTMAFANGAHAHGSVSKTVHGATNEFQLIVIGEKASLSWNFFRPDEIAVGKGKDVHLVRRKEATWATKHAVFHTAGWVEGYVEIIHQLALDVMNRSERMSYPTLQQSLPIMKLLLSANILRKT